MSNLSFSNSRRVTVALPSTRQVDAAFDPKLTYNQAVQNFSDKPDSIIYSIDPKEIVKTLEADRLDDLVSITLGCQLRRDQAAVWDTVFHLTRRDNLNAVIFSAGKDHRPLYASKIHSSSEFLNRDRPITRSHENLVEKGDKIGIAIYNQETQSTYVLLYTVMGHCMTQHLGMEEGTKRSKTSAINLKLDHAYNIGDDNTGVRSDVEDDVLPTANAEAFVEHLAESVHTVRAAYPWKPHFIPQLNWTFDRSRIEELLSPAVASAKTSTFEAFEEQCRAAYNAIRQRRAEDVEERRRLPKEEQGNTPRQTYKLPEVEIITLGDTGTVFARIVGRPKTACIFELPSDYRTKLVERHLYNTDLEGRILTEVSGIFITEAIVPGRQDILRYMTISY